MEYTLELLDDFIAPDVTTRTGFFVEEVIPGQFQIDLQPLIRNLESDSEFIREKASILIAMFLSQSCEPKDAVDAYMTWICEQLRAHRFVCTFLLVVFAVFRTSIKKREKKEWK